MTLIDSPAYSRLNNFPEHLDARKGTRVTYWFGVAYHTQGSRPREHAGHFVSAARTSKDSPPFILCLTRSQKDERERESEKEEEREFI